MGAVDTTYTFTATDTITSSKMNNIIDQTTMTSDAIIGTTLEVASGKLKIRAAGITSNEMGTNSVTTSVITDANVTTAKIADSNVTTVKIADSNVTTVKIADSNVTTVKIADSNVTPIKLSQPFTLGVAQASTSGTSINFTNIPSWAKRVTVMFDKVSTNGSSLFLVQLGDSGGFETTGYESFLTAAATTVATYNTTAGFLSGGGIAARNYQGIIQICLLSGNTWVAGGTLNDFSANNYFLSGSKTLSDTITQVRFTTVNGTDTFDAGTINISYD